MLKRFVFVKFSLVTRNKYNPVLNFDTGISVARLYVTSSLLEYISLPFRLMIFTLAWPSKPVINKWITSLAGFG